MASRRCAPSLQFEEAPRNNDAAPPPPGVPRWCNKSYDAAIIEEEGSPMGPLLRAVNAVAEAIEPEFPDVAISTMACE